MSRHRMVRRVSFGDDDYDDDYNNSYDNNSYDDRNPICSPSTSNLTSFFFIYHLKHTICILNN